MDSKKRDVIIIGHKNPDTDSICSAIAYAELKKETVGPGSATAVCGAGSHKGWPRHGILHVNRYPVAD